MLRHVAKVAKACFFIQKIRSKQGIGSIKVAVERQTERERESAKNNNATGKTTTPLSCNSLIHMQKHNQDVSGIVLIMCHLEQTVSQKNKQAVVAPFFWTVQCQCQVSDGQCQHCQVCHTGVTPYVGVYQK